MSTTTRGPYGARARTVELFERLDDLRACYPQLSLPELAQRLGVRAASLQRALLRHGRDTMPAPPGNVTHRADCGCCICAVIRGAGGRGRRGQ